VIRQHTNNLIILGTPHWSQDVDEASSDPVAGANLAYAITYSAGTPRWWLQEKVSLAQQKGIAVFNSQWSAGKTVKDASSVDLGESQLWVDFLKQNSISDVNWAIFDNDDPSSALQPGVLQVGGWGIESLSGSGRWVRASLRGESPPPPPCEMCATSGQNCKASGCCLDPGMQCFEKDEHFAACRESCAPGIDAQDPPAFQTSWTCKALGGACARTCSAPGANCKYSQCCKDPALTCFEKDKYFSNCQASCTPGVHAADASEFQTSWSCAVVGNASSVPDI